jgi:hypothetical protein
MTHLATDTYTAMTCADAKLEHHPGEHLVCVVFSNTDTAATLLGHLPGREREQIVMELWMWRNAS